MAAVIVSDYFYGEESEQFSYFRIPRLLVRSKKFKTLSTDAKLLYGLIHPKVLFRFSSIIRSRFWCCPAAPEAGAYRFLLLRW